jgi:hypothetical protein
VDWTLFFWAVGRVFFLIWRDLVTQYELLWGLGLDIAWKTLFQLQLCSDYNLRWTVFLMASFLGDKLQAPMNRNFVWSAIYHRMGDAFQ